ncbi:helix-turn-helix domain-containing protein [Macrococcus animalis]|uniref:helix-turn-helix domain-containing protein n=1 Tax=Macrococcus animalis TaxID=3395467 RepID=UPI0039BEAFB4
MTNDEIATAIRWHRENLEYKSKELAAYLNISESNYTRLEKGDRAVTAVELKKIADLFKMTMDELVVIPKRKRR